MRGGCVREGRRADLFSFDGNKCRFVAALSTASARLSMAAWDRSPLGAHRQPTGPAALSVASGLSIRPSAEGV